jgi:hypothetical protein
MDSGPRVAASGRVIGLAAVLGLLAAVGCNGTFKKVTSVGGGGGPTDSTALVQMTLSPSAVTVPPSGQVQYTVTGRLGDGVSVSPIASYVTTGGTITTDGLFTAGTTAGTELVIATQSGGPTGNPPCCTDTSVVTVTAATMARRPSARGAR